MKKLRDSETVKERPGHKIFLLLLVFILLVGNIALFIYFYGMKFERATLNKFVADLSAFKVWAIAFVIVWGVILGALLVAVLPSGNRERPAIVKKVEEPDTSSLKKASTDIDVLYATLQKKGRLKMSMIAQTFKIKKEMALEWSKILESHDLATIRYKAFAEPELFVKEEEE